MYFKKSLIAAIVTAAAESAHAVPALTGTNALTAPASAANTNDRPTRSCWQTAGSRNSWWTSTRWMQFHGGRRHLSGNFRNWGHDRFRRRQ